MKKEKQVKNPFLACNHAVAVHEGHNLLYVRSTKYRQGIKFGDESDNCCGGVSLFNYCPFCGRFVRDIVEKIQSAIKEKKV